MSFKPVDTKEIKFKEVKPTNFSFLEHYWGLDKCRHFREDVASMKTGSGNADNDGDDCMIAYVDKLFFWHRLHHRRGDLLALINDPIMEPGNSYDSYRMLIFRLLGNTHCCRISMFNPINWQNNEPAWENYNRGCLDPSRINRIAYMARRNRKKQNHLEARFRIDGDTFSDGADVIFREVADPDTGLVHIVGYCMRTSVEGSTLFSMPQGNGYRNAVGLWFPTFNGNQHGN